MELAIKYIPGEANKWDVTRAISSVVHADDFQPVIDGRRLNFQVKLNDTPAGGVRNDGTGFVTFPSHAIGLKFLACLDKEPLRVFKKKLKFNKRSGAPPTHVVETLAKTPYLDPNIEEERQNTIIALDEQLRVDAIQFGCLYRPKYPTSPKERLAPRSFSIEWDQDFTKKSVAWLRFDYDHKLFRITAGDELTEREGYTIAISFAGIQKLAVGYDGNPYICFDTRTPPVLETNSFHRTMTGNKETDFRKYKQRIGAINPNHAAVAPYALQLRLVLYNDPRHDVIKLFTDMCQTADLPKGLIINCQPPNQIDALRQGFFTPKRLYELHQALGRFEWPIAFQLESLLHNGILNTGDLDQLLVKIRTLMVRTLMATKSKATASFMGSLLRKYNEALQVRSATESPMSCFQRIYDTFEFAEASNVFRCYHITFTPMRMILEGPYASQSNRIVRQYTGYEDHFIRVDFRDEDRLQYRWDREVDGASFLEERVGRTLKEGFELAGRRFEFLAYSSSALREHAVWFINPFIHPENGQRVCGEYIRDKLGNFQGTELLQCPSKYAARLAQAFTATDPSVKIPRCQWTEIPDMGPEKYLFTDGVGTISRALGDMIWRELCTKTRRDPRRVGDVQPSAYQIRFLGYKGVVAVDEELDKRTDGIQMRLRPSMRKFEARDDDSEEAFIEIAQAFEIPNTCYLNRPLIMLLEDVGVRRTEFQKLQDTAVADAKTIDESITHLCNVLSAHGLGTPYGVKSILNRLRERYKLDLHVTNTKRGIDSPFLRQLRQVAMIDVLRDIKHSARIPVPDSYLLVGIADEGPSYKGTPGYENVFCLSAGEIYACVQRPGDPEPTWIKGDVSISRSPVVHPGDVQRVRAIGKPPEGRICLFRHLKNVVVMPSVGKRSLASCLGGGDVDGDLFSVICMDSLLPKSIEAPAAYEGLETYRLKRDSTVEDICDFVVEYINSDLLGLLSDRLLIIADQSIHGMHDKSCLWLAELCSQAVDYPKQGTPPNVDGSSLPRTLIRCKPDWHAAEVVSPRKTDYYESNKALGFLFRAITVDEEDDVIQETNPPVTVMADPISAAILEDVRSYLGDATYIKDPSPDLMKIFRRYVDELRYITSTHTLSNTSGKRLLEAEVVVGTIIAKCSQKRWRKDRTYRMRLHAETLVKDIRKDVIGSLEDKTDVIRSLESAWGAWMLTLRYRDQFGANSFSFIALGMIFDCLDKLSLQTHHV